MTSFNESYAQQVATYLQDAGGSDRPVPIFARVTHVVQGPLKPGTKVRDQYYTSPSDLNKITFEVLTAVQDFTAAAGGNFLAKPKYGSITQIPVEGEIVELEIGPGLAMNGNKSAKEVYYSMPFNLWNATHHNAFPNFKDYASYIAEEVARSYQDASLTNQPVNTSVTGGLAYPLGRCFPEKSNVKNLRLFTGDFALEGRWGNSIRFGSTTGCQRSENYWSKAGEPGNPITIIRNGQGRQIDKLGYIPTVENINTDPSSIYLTNGQEIKIDGLSDFPLESLGTLIASSRTFSLPIQQQLTSTDNTSAQEQDNFTHNTLTSNLS